MLILEQKGGPTQTKFLFQQEGLEYSVKDSGGTKTFFVEYQDISIPTSKIEEKNLYLRNLAWAWFAIGTLQALVFLWTRSIGSFPIFLFVGAFCLWKYSTSRATFTIFQTPHGPLYVREDPIGPQILGEIADRRFEQIRQRYARIADLNHPDQEAARFEWLTQNKFITEEEKEALYIDLRLALTEKAHIEKREC